MERSLPNPAQTEPDWLAAVERESANVSPQLTAMIPVDRPASVAELQAAVAYTRRVEDWYLHMLGPANALGFGRLTQRLNDVLADVRRSRSTCEKMLLDRIAAQQAAFASQPPPPPPPDPAAARNAAIARQQAEWEEARRRQQAQFEAAQEAHRKQQEMFDAQNKAWSDSFNKH